MFFNCFAILSKLLFGNKNKSVEKRRTIRGVNGREGVKLFVSNDTNSATINMSITDMVMNAVAFHFDSICSSGR